MSLGKIVLISAIVVVNVATIVVGSISGKKFEEKIISSIMKEKEAKTGE